ncbi:hypothetical protein [Eggerthella sinensis]|uniref:hypothetical protein n=1 Tax=Eggerthella sinensis TaxID=242230 RepID=UPI0022E522FD|nr:hypothetical protein [Eggerthella sinensis]
MKSAMCHDPSFFTRVDPGMASHGTLLLQLLPLLWQTGAPSGEHNPLLQRIVTPTGTRNGQNDGGGNAAHLPLARR